MKINFANRHRKRAFLLFLIYIFSIIANLIPISFAASPPNSFYISLKTIHMDNPKWTYEEFVTKINDISNYTLSDTCNKYGAWINPYVYEKYNQLVVYGTPHGKTSPTGTTTADFFINSNGGMFNIESKKQGEYRHIGYNLGGISVTNDYWHNTSYTGTGTFSTKEDYTDLAYTTISGASASWNNVDAEMRNYILNSYFNDDDYITGGKTPFTLSSLWSDDFISNHVLIQVEPGIVRQGSLKMVYNNGKNHNTLTIDPIDFSFSGNLTTDKNTYTIPAGQNEVVVDVTMNATFANSTANVYLKDVEFSCMGEQKNISVTSGEKYYKAEGIKKTFSRNNLQTGSNTVVIDGIIQVNSHYKDYRNLKVSKTITIVVEENPDPWVTAVMTATPNVVLFQNSSIPVKLDIAYGISNIKNLSDINNVSIIVDGEGDFPEQPVLVGEKKLSVILSSSFMNGYNERDKTYNLTVKYNMKDGKSYSDTASAVVRVSKTVAITPIPTPGPTPTPIPGPTPTPIPVSTNNPPSIRLNAPAEVKAGDNFSVNAYASDPDGDSITYEWNYNPAKKAGIISNTYASLYYDVAYANTNQSVEVFVSDGEDGALDMKVIRVTPPSVDARMQVDGSFKVNRKITMSDISDTPDQFPIATRLWTVSPVTASGTTAADIKHSGDWISVSEDLLFKKAGQYKITLYLKNSAGYEDTVEKIITITPDVAPITDFVLPEKIYRQEEHNNRALILLQDKSYSIDNDTITQRIWQYRYDSDNDGSFLDESWVTLSSANLKEYAFYTQNIGRYEFGLTCKESFGQDTIVTLITSSDYLTSSYTQVIEVANVAPIISLSVESKEKIDIVFSMGNTAYSKSEITEKINNILKPALQAQDVDFNISIVDGGYSTGKYIFDIYDGYSDWVTEKVVKSTHEWTRNYGLRYEPVLDGAWGYIHPTSMTDGSSNYGGDHWNYSTGVHGEYDRNAKTHTRIDYMISYKEHYEVRDWGEDEDGIWTAFYDTTYTEKRKTLVDYRIKNKKILTITAPDGSLPNDGRIMGGEWVANNPQYIDRPYSYWDDEIWQIVVVHKPFHAVLHGNWSIKRGAEINSNFDTAITMMPTYREDAKKYFIYVTDNNFTHNTTYDKINENDITVVGLGKAANKTIFESLSTYYANGGLYIDNSNLTTALNTLTNNITSNIVPSSITKYITVGQTIQHTKSYSDYENDPQYDIRYRYNHDPNYFDNSLGLALNIGEYFSTPKSVFDKPGLYEVDVSVRDNPKNNNNFDSYRLWSHPRKINLYVHREPVSVFNVSIVKNEYSYGYSYDLVYKENSYDPDHTSRVDKGIMTKKWYYREASNMDWIEGKPTSTRNDKIYFIKLEVMDMEYTWASSVQKVCDAERIPVAQFHFKSNPASKYNYSKLSDVIVDTSTTHRNYAILERKWTVKKNGIIQPNGVNTVLTTSGEGQYEVTLEIRDALNQWSAPFTKILTVVGDTIPPTLSLTPAIRPWGNTNVAVTMNCADTGGSGLKEVRYLWTENTDFADGEFTTVATTGNISRTQTANGNWYLYAQAIDNAGNASPIVKGGAYQIDKTAPTLLDYKVTGEDYRSGNTFWISKNNSVDVYIKSMEKLSGMRYTHLRVPQGGDNRASHDWDGNATNLNEFDTSTYTDITAAERTLSDLDKGEYEVRFTLKGLNDVVSDLQYYFSDKVGNVVGYNNSGYKIGVDTLPPIITITPGQRDLGKTEITASVSVSDSGSGVKESKYIVSTSATKPAAGAGWTSVFNTNFNVDITGTGTWYLYVESVDNVGNPSYARAGAFKVDLEGPVITANPINRVWDNSNALISLTAAEAYSSLKEVRYSVTNNTGRVYGGWQHVNANQNNAVEIIENGTWYLHVEAEDVAGNITYTYFGPYRVDKEAPVLTMGYVGGARYISGNNYYARQGDTVTFWMQGVDALSGMWRLLALARDGVTDPYRGAVYNNTFPAYNTHTRVAVNTPTVTINNGKTLRANFPYQILSTGDFTYRIEGIADDLATYNRHGWVDKGYRLIVDNTAPVLAVDNTGGQCIGMASIEITSTDIGSGVKNISYTWTNTQTPPSNGWTTASSNAVTALMSNEGAWYLHIKSADNVDNISTTESYGPYEVIHINASDFKITQIYDMAWRGYYFNLHAGIDTNGDGEPDQFPKRANTDIMTTSMPINKNHLISYSADGIKAGYKFEGSVAVLGEPDSVSFRINYKANNTQKFDILFCTKATGNIYEFEWIVPLETDADTYLEFDLIVVKGTDTYSNEVWADTWPSGNTSRRVMYVVEGSATDDLTFIQSK